MSKKYGKSPNKKKVHSLKPTNHPKNRPVAPKEERIVSQPPWLSGAKRLVMWTYKSVIEDHLFLTPHVICTRVKTPHLSLGDKLIPPWKIRESLFKWAIFEPLKTSWIYEFIIVYPLPQGEPICAWKTLRRCGRSFFRWWTMLRSHWPRRKAWILMEAASSPEGMDGFHS